MTAHINIGSNLGDRYNSIEAAVAGIRCIKGVNVTGISSPVESEAWGYESCHTYVNVGVNAETDLPPHELLKALRDIEISIDNSSHRTSDGNYADRVIDIDLIAVDDIEIYDPPYLILPHPRMHLRRFVLEPMTTLCPDWIHPLLGKTPEQLMASLGRPGSCGN